MRPHIDGIISPERDQELRTTAEHIALRKQHQPRPLGQQAREPDPIMRRRARLLVLVLPANDHAALLDGGAVGLEAPLECGRPAERAQLSDREGAALQRRPQRPAAPSVALAKDPAGACGRLRLGVAPARHAH